MALEVVNEGSEEHGDGVGLHLRAGQAAPSKVVVHAVEAALGGGSLVVEFHDTTFS